MADKELETPGPEEVEHDSNYVAPAKKSISEILEMDDDDESLKKYKQALLGALPTTDADVPNVQVVRLTLVCKEAPEIITMDLTEDLEALKKKSFVLKEGVEYKIKIHFKVNKEIVSGLKYIQTTSRQLFKDTSKYMVGSYGPRVEEYESLTPTEEAPKGMMVRGTYNIHSRFSDDDQHDHLVWGWKLHIKKEWKD
ncbi:rho GDP-dissociation inhibitor 3 [Callorhinchus milii]|uniref:Rho GDP-dissociation inhibitor 1-like protein n=1 Tax=Callorhinchus milii TaxID=7868 RepID=K4G038_CALMI|nr:rho GDP-dissociation inhibitor 3 [Callorhinchus milii]AFK10591.1 rho GDP-dissociation inhibitor 1-like protein [Callorhinchus milii]